jgi:tryptophan-rich sensory protein
MAQTKQWGRWPWLAGYLAASFGVAALGSRATTASVDTWYRTIRTPDWKPPNWAFGPVWTLLYTLMAVAAWDVHQVGQRRPERAPAARQALLAWWVQLALNLAWSVVFFGQRRIGGGLAVIAVLWAAIALCLARSAAVSRRAGLLLAPYLAWTTLAAALNARIWQLNRPPSGLGGAVRESLGGYRP